MDDRDVRLSASALAHIRRLARPAERDPSDAGGEVNVVPFLDIVMNVLMFVLATIPAVFTATILVAAPPRGKDQHGRPPPSLGFALVIVEDGVALRTSSGAIGRGCESGAGPAIARVGASYDWAGLRACAAKIKAASPDFEGETEVKILADPGVPYHTLIAAMDAVRENDDGAPLFPDVNFALVR